MLKTLVAGEFNRLIKYKILHVGLAVSVLWVILIAFLSKTEVANFAPMLIFMDTGMMAVMLIGAMMYFEKQEGTLRTTFITPVKIWQILFAKIFASVLMGFISVLLVSLAAMLIHGISVNIFLLLIYSAVIITASCSVGFIFIFFNKDFNAMLLNYTVYFLVLFVPVILFMLNVLPESLTDIQLISPFYVAQMLITSTFTEVSLYTVLISLAYNIILSVLLLRFYAGKKLKAFSIGG